MKKRIIFITTITFLFVFLGYVIHKDISNEKRDFQIDFSIAGTSEKEVCIGSFQDFAFRHEGEIEFGNQEELPQFPWKLISTLPTIENPLSLLEFVLVSGIEEQNIWINGVSSNLQALEDKGKIRNDYFFYVFSSKSNDWRIISRDVYQGKIWVDNIIETSDGEILGLNRWNIDNPPGIDEIPLISKFNAEKGKFEMLGDLSLSKVNIDKDFFDFNMIFEINSELYLINQGIGVFEVDLKKDRLLGVFESFSSNISSVAYYSDYQLIIILDKNYQDPKIYQGEVIILDLESGQIQELNLPDFNWPSIENMHIDFDGNIWMSSTGYLTSEGDWNLLHPDPEGLIKNLKFDRSWYVPIIKFRDSSGVLWFSKIDYFDPGIAWFDPEINMGCWVTNILFSDVIETSRGKIFLLADKKLYTQSK